MALAQQLLASGRGVNGSAYFIAGMNSGIDPAFVDDRGYFSAMNIVNRGGLAQTRPGYQCRFQIPDGNLQGGCYYRPLGGAPFLVFAVDGIIYTTRYPFNSYHALPGIKFYAAAPKIYWQVATKSVEQAQDGTLTIIDPIRLLVMQDGGYTKAAYYDGTNSRHLNPSDDETPLGGPMAWSGDRLWVAVGNQLFASDITDPLTFTEVTYLAEGGSFYTAEPITAMAEIPGLATPQLSVFTETDSILFQSGIRDRTTWKSQVNPPFQSSLFPGVGCVSHRSIVNQAGLLWWMTLTGLTNFNAATQAKLSSVLAPQDMEMAVSKGNISPNIADTAGASFENYGLFSVPSGDKKNRHTWVLDQAVVAGLEKTTYPTWNSVWTGTYPVEWMVGPMAGVQKIFHVSKDADGHNRLWEAFTADRLDNGQPITSYVETKLHLDFSPKATGLDLKEFLFAEVHFTEMYGDVSAAVYWCGTRGRYKKIAEFDFSAKQGQLTEGVVMQATDILYGYRPQSRTVRTPGFNSDDLKNSDCATCGIESDNRDNIDVGFSLLIVWSGRAALRWYRVFVDPKQEAGVGTVPKPETGKTNVVVDALCEMNFAG